MKSVRLMGVGVYGGKDFWKRYVYNIVRLYLERTINYIRGKRQPGTKLLAHLDSALAVYALIPESKVSK